MIADSPRAAFAQPTGLMAGGAARLLSRLRRGRDVIRDLIEAVERRDIRAADLREQLRALEKDVRDARRSARSR